MSENTLQSPPQPSATASAATEAALPAAVVEARAAITARTSDRAFAQRFAAGDATARAEMNALHQAAYPEPATEGVPAVTVTLDDAAKAALAAEQAKQPAVHEPDAIDAHLAEIGFTPGRAEEFRLPRLTDPDAPFDKAAQAVDATARGWLTAGRFDSITGSALAKDIDRTAQRWEKMNEGERQLWQQSEKLRLERLGFNSERIALARQFVEELEVKAKGVIELLERTGAGNSAVVVSALTLHAERLLARHGRK